MMGDLLVMMTVMRPACWSRLMVVVVMMMTSVTRHDDDDDDDDDDIMMLGHDDDDDDHDDVAEYKMIGGGWGGGVAAPLSQVHHETQTFRDVLKYYTTIAQDKTACFFCADLSSLKPGENSEAKHHQQPRISGFGVFLSRCPKCFKYQRIRSAVANSPWHHMKPTLFVMF